MAQEERAQAGVGLGYFTEAIRSDDRGFAHHPHDDPVWRYFTIHHMEGPDRPEGHDENSKKSQ